MSGGEMAGEELWQECCHWLARIELITRDHVLTSENAKLADLCRFLRDGVMICKILHILDEGCIDLRAINQRPQNAQVQYELYLQCVFFSVYLGHRILFCVLNGVFQGLGLVMDRERSRIVLFSGVICIKHDGGFPLPFSRFRLLFL